ncbi:stabilizer of axonemal microtubules 2 [Lingula anatina]|uniref:Stabilizer of axonemal microtubules 2 n=1 Tax=Lingula anatina TaxID=7574 RepID=A0A1S3JT67_LINAN|nr:stabilizer of axonemal microtubules 2 [Lingula anatina]|eukprot:XP_013413580.1 stabilizer of axonemal microtubules 2 [Lingula anatina]
MTRRCICEICNCGRHRCPHRPLGVINRGGTPCLISEYNTNYLGRFVPPRPSLKPKTEAMHSSGPMADKTTNRVDYVKHPTERPYVHQPEVYKPVEGEMDMTTSYRKEYIGRPIEPAKAVKRDGQRKVEGKFEGEPTYRTDYRKWALPKKMVHTQEPWMPPTAKMDGNSTFQHDYIRHNIPVTKSCKPEEAAMMSEAPLEDMTGYREAYNKKPIPPKYVRDKPTWQPPTMAFDGLSTNKRDFQGKKAPRAPSQKPDQSAFISDQPFKGTTTCREDFKRWPVERPFVHEPEQWVKPQGEMDLRSTTHLEFTKKPMDRTLAKAKPEWRPSSAAFDGSTNYNHDYRKWNLGNRPRPTMKPDYVPNNAPFEGISTFTAHYIPKNAAPARSCKPDQSAFMSSAPFEDGTMYRMEYVKKKSSICPAAILDTSQSSYRYRDQDERGHKWYQPIIETVTELPKGTNNIPVPQVAEIAVA